ncbi:MAG: PqqD family protein [Acidobacteria bacterium]|nr:PqqD family protein [Acidobacteriota bacterium]
METNPKARQKGLVVQEMPDEVLVYDLDSNKAHCLNSSAALVWRSCDGTRTVTDIVREFETSGAGQVSEDFVWLAIDQLQENQLLENEVRTKFDGHSRRQVLKTIGLASIVAVPVIASLVAPPSALAATSCACNVNGDCTTRSACPSTTNCNTNFTCAT